MKFVKVASVLLISLALIISCSKKTKTMSVDDFIKIENEINLPDPDLNPEKVKEVVSKHGYTVEQFKEFSAKKESDPKIKEQLGEAVQKMKQKF